MIWHSYVLMFFIVYSYGQDGNSSTGLDLIAKQLYEIAPNISSILSVGQNSQEIYNEILPQFLAGEKNEDVSLGIEALLLKYNKPVESHDVTTTDGYVLKMFRIPSNGPVVFLMHGLLCSADDFVVAGPQSGLAYLLSDAGYDVWLGNARGNKYSRKHLYLDPSNHKFWDFSWNEIGIYDLPAMIEYALKKTGQPTLKYIGHSQGTTTFFVLTSERPEYNTKISSMIALAPVGYMSHLKSPVLRLLAPLNPVAQIVIQELGSFEFLPSNRFVNTIKNVICSGLGIFSEILCTNIVFLITGFDIEQVNITNLPVIFAHVPSGSSVKQLVHYGQEINSGRFAKYDYGIFTNQTNNETKVSPEYNLNLITTPVHLFYSDNDWLSSPIDVDKLSKKLSNVVEVYKIPYKNFNHLDYLYAKDVKTLVYDKILALIRNS